MIHLTKLAEMRKEFARPTEALFIIRDPFQNYNRPGTHVQIATSIS